MIPPVTNRDELCRLARRIRELSLTAIHAAGSGHPGGSLSAADILAVLFFNVLRHDPKNPGNADRDRFILSKGHACPALYAAYALAGYVEEPELNTLRKFGSPFQGHPDRRHLPVVEANTGSLGCGLSLGVGMAMAARLDAADWRTYVMLGDGECQEGQIWEAAMFAGNQGLHHLIAIVDKNKIQLDGFVSEINDLESLADKFRAFKWNVIETDGHDMETLPDAFAQARAESGAPSVLLAHTVKGKGVSFMETAGATWHGIAPNQEELGAALAELAG